MVTAIAGAGTAEEAWRGWPAPSAWPRLDLRPYARVVVVAPHPDDEILGVGGILRLLVEAGTPVTVVAVTDGEGSHPGVAGIAERRTAESLAALADLGLAPSARRRLGVRDGGVGGSISEVSAALTPLLGPDVLCLSTWRGDGHPDHEATGHAAAQACDRSGATLLEYPIWTWHWADVDDPRVPWDRAGMVDLPPAVAERKAQAVSRFVSQTEVNGTGPEGGEILPPSVLARFARGWETVLR